MEGKQGSWCHHHALWGNQGVSSGFYGADRPGALAWSRSPAAHFTEVAQLQALITIQQWKSHVQRSCEQANLTDPVQGMGGSWAPLLCRLMTLHIVSFPACEDSPGNLHQTPGSLCKKILKTPVFGSTESHAPSETKWIKIFHFNKITKWLVCTFKFENRWPRYFILCVLNEYLYEVYHTYRRLLSH